MGPLNATIIITHLSTKFLQMLKRLIAKYELVYKEELFMNEYGLQLRLCPISALFRHMKNRKGNEFQTASYRVRFFSSIGSFLFFSEWRKTVGFTCLREDCYILRLVIETALIWCRELCICFYGFWFLYEVNFCEFVVFIRTFLELFNEWNLLQHLLKSQFSCRYFLEWNLVLIVSSCVLSAK